MEVIDAQVHVWEPDSPLRPWTEAAPPALGESGSFPFFDGSNAVSDVEMLRRMDDVGVDAAILVTSGRHYGFDNSYALGAAARHPDRFAVVARMDPDTADLDRQIDELVANPSAIGVRLLAFGDAAAVRLRAGEFDRLLAAAAAAELPLCLYMPDALGDLATIPAHHPTLQIVLDHLGLAQRPLAGVGNPDPFRRLAQVLELAAHENVAVKLSGVATMSWGSFPYGEVWPHVHRVLDAFGLDRVMWGSDCTRAEGVATYEQGLQWLTDAGELSQDELELVLGRTLRRIFRWD